MLSFFKYFILAVAFGSAAHCEYEFENEVTEVNNEKISEYFVCLYDENEFNHFKKQLQTTINIQESEVTNLKVNLQNYTENLKTILSELNNIKVRSLSELKNMKNQLTELNANHTKDLKKSMKDQLAELNKNHTDDLRNSFSELTNMKNQLTEINENHTEDLKSVLLELKSMKNQLMELHKKIPNENHPMNCDEALRNGRKNGVYHMYLGTNEISYTAYCSKDSDGGDAWTVIQRRQDGSEDFNRDWSDYKKGFGNLSGEYWLGLERIHLLTMETRQELLVKMQDDDGKFVTARYDNFVVGKESDGYPLQQLGKFSGTAGDALEVHLSMKFSTKDKDNDIDEMNCAEGFKSGWWYCDCYISNLNGVYMTNPITKGGVQWRTYKRDYSLKFVSMLIRPYSQ